MTVFNDARCNTHTVGLKVINGASSYRGEGEVKYNLEPLHRKKKEKRRMIHIST